MGKVTVISSGKGGTGKSTVAVGLAAAFSSIGNKVLLVDFNQGTRSLNSLVAPDGDVVFDLNDVINNKVNLATAVCCSDVYENVFLLSASLSVAELDCNAVEKFFIAVSEKYDNVIVDIQQNFIVEVKSAFPFGTDVLVVSECNRVSLEACNNLFKNLEICEKLKYKLILNKFNRNKILKFKLNIDKMIDIVGVSLIGIIPYDKHLENIYLAKKRKRINKGRVKYAFSRIAARLIGLVYPLPKIKDI